MKKRIIVGMGTVILTAVGFVCLCMWLLSGAGSAYYYTQIDNSRMEQGDLRKGVVDLQGGMGYSYTLPAYDERGVEKDITFGASRELRESAFLRLTVMPVRGVVEWSEVEYEELPIAVQARYTAPESD